MSIWFKEVTIEEINEKGDNTMVSNCGIKISKVTDNTIEGTMPVDDRTKQPFGILHGGANCVLAETLGSFAANYVCNPESEHAVGLSITTSHIKASRNGIVTGIAAPIHLGRTTHVWEIKTYNEQNQITSDTKLTMAIIKRLGK